MKNLYFLLATLFVSNSLLAQQTSIPDDNFEQALIDLGYDNVLDDSVQTSKISGVTNLDLRFKNISDLTGIEDFTGLVDLNCSFNDLTIIDVSSNTALTSLSCAVNFLVALDLSNNSALTYLDCGLNNITSLDLSGNSALTELYCDYNNLADLDVSNGNNVNFSAFDARENPNLNCIDVDNVGYSTTNWSNRDSGVSFSTDCGGSSPNLTYVPDDNFEQALIDLGHDNVLDDYVATGNVSSLTSLNVSSSNISDLTGIEAFVSLTVLNCGSNDLSVLDLSNNTALTTLSCYLNNLNSINLSNNTSLINLSCYFNELISLDLSINTALRSLSCGNNSLVNLNVANGNNTNFTYFDARNNPDLDCIQVDDAVYSASNWTNKDTDAGFSTDCDAIVTDLTYVPDNNFEQALIDLGYDDVLDDYVPTENIDGLESLNVTDMGISDLTGIEAFVSLTSLSCGSNSIGSLDMSNSTSLIYLYCHNNNLTSLNVSNNLALSVLSCYLNDLTDLDLGGNPTLRALSTGSNTLTSLNVRNGNNSNFTYFDASNNTNLDCIEVDNVSYSNTNWTNKDVGASFSTDCDAIVTDLTYVPDNNFEQALIDLGYDDVLDDYVPTENIDDIESLNVTDMGISDLTGIEAFVSLTSLSCGSNSIGSLDVSNSPALRYLYCYNNNLTSLNVSNNPALSVLSCYLNDLTDLDVSSNPALRALSTGNNSLVSLNVRNGNNSNFTYFDASNNTNLDCIEVDNVSYSNTNWTNKDVGASFSTDCDAIVTDLTYVPDNNFEQALIDLGYDDVLDDYVPTENIDDIESLNVTDMGISDLTGIEAFVSLTSLSCGSNSIGSLDVSNSPALRYLYCYNNNLTSLNVSNNPALSVLSCYLNDLTDLDVSSNPALRALSTGNNSLVSLNVRNGNNSNFTQFDARNNPSLDCIEVDNVSYSNTNWTDKDAGARFSTNCGVFERSSSKKKVNKVSYDNVSLSSSTEELENGTYKIYPNPVTDVLNISLNNGLELKQVTFYNTLSQRVLYAKTSKIDVTSLREGIYLLEVETNKGRLVERIVIK